MDIGISAAAHEQAREQAQLDLEQVSLGSAYLDLQNSVAWKDIQSGLDEQVQAAEFSILEIAPGETLEMKRDKFVRYQEWKKIRTFLTDRVTSMTENYKHYIKETTQHGHDHA
jgi:hypothetical protein